MTKPELNSKLQELRLKYESQQKELMREYCDANNPYQIGDKFTDHIGTIIVQKITYYYSTYESNMPCCVYYGLELKKDGTPKKNGSKRQAWQSNDIKNRKR